MLHRRMVVLVDIAGEVNEMESAYSFDDAARTAGVMLMPGAGFGVVPTDIAAAVAIERCPGATTLKIFYATQGGASRGTLKTVLKDINSPGVQRVAGKFVEATPVQTNYEFVVANKRFSAVYNPWRADLFTAHVSTGVSNIETYSVFPGFIVWMMKGRRLWLRDLILNRLLGLLPEGPSNKQLNRGRTYVEAIATDGENEASASLVGPEAYLFTVICVREIVTRVMDGRFEPGFQTPSYYGKQLLDGIDGVEWN